MADCEDFMIAMCKPKSEVTVSTLLDYILAGEKYGLTRVLEAAVDLCAQIDYQLLSGKSKPNFIALVVPCGMNDRSEPTEDIPISWKFSKIELKTQFAIAEKRLLQLEKNKGIVSSKRKSRSGHSIPLS